MDDQQPDSNSLSMFDEILSSLREKQLDPTNNLEYDIKESFIADKVKNSEVYSQNLYAALCNNQFCKKDAIFEILKEEYYSCSWRYAGGIISDIRGHGDYLDWYCSGIGIAEPDHVGEGYITEEVLQDLNKIGWIVVKNDE